MANLIEKAKNLYALLFVEKKIHKKKWFWPVVIILVLAGGANNSDQKSGGSASGGEEDWERTHDANCNQEAAQAALECNAAGVTYDQKKACMRLKAQENSSCSVQYSSYL